jgi:hypothetical protein
MAQKRQNPHGRRARAGPGKGEQGRRNASVLPGGNSTLADNDGHHAGHCQGTYDP